MVPTPMLDSSNDGCLRFFEKKMGVGGVEEWALRQVRTESSSSRQSSSAQQQQERPKQIVVPSRDPVQSLMEVICTDSHRKKKFPADQARNSAQSYELFIDFVHRMLAYDPKERIKPGEALNHPFITEGERDQAQSTGVPFGAAGRR